MKLGFCDRSDWVWSMIKIKQDNNVIDRIGLLYAKNDNELLGPIRLGVVYDENRHDNDVIYLLHVVYVENEIELS